MQIDAKVIFNGGGEMSGEHTISGLAYLALTEYLERHESDIAEDINDFGGLKGVFEEVVGRPPDE